MSSDTSNNEKTGDFTFIWKIEEFSHCVLNTKYSVLSPSFEILSSEWKLHLIVYGKDFCKTSDCIYIKPLPSNSDYDEPFGYVELSLLDADGLTLVRKEVESWPVDNDYDDYVNLVSRDEVFGRRKDEFLPQDTLTVQCRMWIESQEQPEPAMVFAKTRIGFERMFFNWTLPNLFPTFTQQRYKKQVEAKSVGIPPLSVELFLQRVTDNVEMEIITTGEFLSGVFAIFNVSFLNNTTNEIIKDGQHFFDPEKDKQFYRFPTLGKRETLKKSVALTLKFEVTFNGAVLSEETRAHPFEYNSYLVHENQDTIIRDLQRLYEEGILCDFNLRSSDKTFPVHKTVLCARSSVFRAMFTADMKERESDIVDIPDVDADTLQRMLLFVYSDRVQDLKWESASKLYTAADKYAIEPLKHLHQDQELKLTVQDYIVRHDKDTIGTEEWKAFQKNHLQLTVEILSDLYMRKVRSCNCNCTCNL